jgi:hypothetical protein
MILITPDPSLLLDSFNVRSLAPMNPIMPDYSMLRDLFNINSFHVRSLSCPYMIPILPDPSLLLDSFNVRSLASM